MEIVVGDILAARDSFAEAMRTEMNPETFKVSRHSLHPFQVVIMIRPTLNIPRQTEEFDNYLKWNFSTMTTNISQFVSECCILIKMALIGYNSDVQLMCIDKISESYITNAYLKIS